MYISDRVGTGLPWFMMIDNSIDEALAGIVLKVKSILMEVTVRDDGRIPVDITKVKKSDNYYIATCWW